MKGKHSKFTPFLTSSQGSSGFRRTRRLLPFTGRLNLLAWIGVSLAFIYIILSLIELRSFKEEALKKLRMRDSAKLYFNANNKPEYLKQETFDTEAFDLSSSVDGLPAVHPLAEPPTFDVSAAEKTEDKHINREPPLKLQAENYDPHLALEEKYNVSEGTSDITTGSVSKTKMNFGYTEEISSNISVQRDIPDGRHDSCKISLATNLTLKASVIISVYNEEKYVLLRTIHSVMKQSPVKLLSEVILIDDYSTSELTYMHELQDYVKTRWNNVHIYKNEERKGLIWSRNYGAAKAVGDVIVFLDSHVEVNKGWLEPLLERIETDRHIVAVPMMDTISPHTFQYTPTAQVPKMVNAFNWDLSTYKIPSPKSIQMGEMDPIPVPITSHGQFAISKSFLDLLDGFDPNLELLGAENLEMSFKAWMCGGRVELVPCARIAHVDRGIHPSLNSTKVDQKIQKNLLRVAKTWMDDHSIFYENSMKSIKELNYGDIAGRIRLKESLKCKSFDWYLKNVYPQLYNPKGKIIADAEIRSLGMDRTLCLEASSTNLAVARMRPCTGKGGSQRWWYTTRGELRRYDHCLDYWGKQIQFYPCHGLQGNQMWLYMSDVNRIKHVNSYKCMTVTSQDTVDLEPCEDDNFVQQWTMSNFNQTAYEESGFSN